MTFQNALVAGLFTHSNCRRCRSKDAKTGIQDFAIKVFHFISLDAANRCSLLASFLFMPESIGRIVVINGVYRKCSDPISPMFRLHHLCPASSELTTSSHPRLQTCCEVAGSSLPSRACSTDP